jgi:uncharacterized repeat protein (TIGR01451 family)
MHGQSTLKFLRLVLLVFLLCGLPFTSTAAAPSSTAGNSPGATHPASVSTLDSNILDVPLSSAALTMDGKCNEYTAAATQTFTDGNGKDATVYLEYSGGFLYVCLQAQPGTFDQRFAAIYLDPQGDGSSYTYAQKDDYGFQVGIKDGTTSSYNGTGIGGYASDPSLDSLWQGAATVDPSGAGESAEYALDVGRWFIQPCSLFGIAVYHQSFAAAGDDYGWPSNHYYDQPKTWQLARLDNGSCSNGKSGKIAYVFHGNTESATSFYNLLVAHGYSVDLVPLADVLTSDFSTYDLILIADDTGDLDQWGTPGNTDAQVAKIVAGYKPIIGLGEGGYAFFGRIPLFIGWPNGWHGPQDKVKKSSTAPAAFYTGLASDPVTHYITPVNSVGIYTGTNPLPADFRVIGQEVPTSDHASLSREDCRLLWGASGNPLAMSTDGKTLFLNAVGYMRFFQCSRPTLPPKNCITIDKTSNPPSGTTIAPGDIIEYTITYTVSNDPTCKEPTGIRLVDTIPADTIFVPGSATGGISPGADGSLVWAVTPATSAQTAHFKVVVSENQCVDQHSVNNRAGLLVPDALPVISSMVSHPVNCPPVGLPNENPMFAEDEISINPYPLVTGHPSEISVRLTNDTGTPQPVTVKFQTSPVRFGIGLTFSSFATKSATIPAHSNIILKTNFTPVSSGHYCVQIVVTGPGLTKPLVTQRNLDVSEDLTAGTPDLLKIPVQNNSSGTADISLVVDNTCPGWDAQIIDPPGGLLTGVTPGEIVTATLQVTPPNPVSLGTGCHIDVQGWIGDTLIGGIRKLDVPPVQLPTNVNPPWEEPEISFEPDPPVVGRAGKICIDLQNPLPYTRTVTVDFSVADFSAGVPFTPVGSTTVNLPPNSYGKYCINWTPGTGGTLHRCVLATLKQSKYPDMRSQHNVDLVRPRTINLGDLDIPFHVFNPDLVKHTLNFDPTIFGIDPYWKPSFVDDNGAPAPNEIMAGQMLNLHLRFLPAIMQSQAPSAPPADYLFGDESKVEVSVLMDGVQTSGFSVKLALPTLFLPVLRR